jgi:hypothetical protein
VALDAFSRLVVGWSIESTDHRLGDQMRSGWPPTAATALKGR